MAHHFPTQSAAHTSDTENKNISFQPLLKISRTEQLVITHQEVLKISHTEETVVVSPSPDEKTHSVQQENIHLANARKNLEQTFEKHHQKNRKKPNDESSTRSGLDCSGQGMCQPNIEPSDNDTMQQILVKANVQQRKEKIKKRLKQTKDKKI